MGGVCSPVNNAANNGTGAERSLDRALAAKGSGGGNVLF